MCSCIYRGELFINLTVFEQAVALSLMLLATQKEGLMEQVVDLLMTFYERDKLIQ